MQNVISLLLILLLCTACAQTPAVPEESPQEPEAGTAAEPETGPEDFVLLTLEAPLSDGRTLTLEAVGKVEDEYTAGVREVRVYDGNQLLQTVSVREAIEEEWDFGDGVLAEEFFDYTNCWKPEGSMEVLDLNFDGNTDFGLFGWPANNTIPYYYWIWDAEAEQYRYVFTLQAVDVHPEEGEISSQYNSGGAGSKWVTEFYRPNENHQLYLDRVEISNWEESDDNDRAAHEIWLPPEGSAPIRPGDPSLNIETDLILVRRERPTTEVSNGTASHYTEIWELQDGAFQMTGREEFFYP